MSHDEPDPELEPGDPNVHQLVSWMDSDIPMSMASYRRVVAHLVTKEDLARAVKCLHTMIGPDIASADIRDELIQVRCLIHTIQLRGELPKACPSHLARFYQALHAQVG